MQLLLYSIKLLQSILVKVIGHKHGNHEPFFSVKWASTNKVHCKYPGNKIRILKNISGVLKPVRLVLKLSICNDLDSQIDKYDVTIWHIVSRNCVGWHLLGPPESRKTTFLQALAGKSEKLLKVLSFWCSVCCRCSKLTRIATILKLYSDANDHAYI